jgi:subtilisin family serine protease
MRLKFILTLVVCLAVVVPAGAQQIGINVVLKTPITTTILADLGTHGTVRDLVPAIQALTMSVRSSELPAIQALPYVAAANPDQERKGIPVKTSAVSDSSAGYSTWDLDAINVTTGPGPNTRAVSFTGNGVYVAVLDTGLVNNWPAYFPANLISVEHARAFGGGGAYGVGEVSSQPNKWGEDQNSHGTHVTSTILGYNYGGNIINGVAPRAHVIPVKVLNQNGNGWSSVIARGIEYIGELKDSTLKNSPVVINMSLGGPGLDAMEKAAIDFAIGKGVIIVAAAGNEGMAGMGYPGAYDPVISVAAAGWTGEWQGSWVFGVNVAEKDASQFYICDFSSRAINANQHLDVAAPGSWVLGPYQVNGQLSYYYLGGTSMATPHVAGTVALMAEKKPGLTAAQAESTLMSTALALAPGCRTVFDPYVGVTQYCWGANANGAGLIQADAALAKTK